MIVVIRILFMLFFLFINVSNNQVESINSRQITIDRIFLLEKASYCVLFYLQDCPSCKVIFDYIDQCLSNNENIYYVNLESLESENKQSQQNNIGQNDYHQIRVNISPTLLEIENYCITNQIEGMENIHNYLELNYYQKILD